jgi:hypothetical protein
VAGRLSSEGQYIAIELRGKTTDVLPSTLAILVQKCFFSMQALLKNRGHVLITKINEAGVIR